MKIEKVARMTPYGRLFYWIQEREELRLRREAGQTKPWTDDTILQQYRFCNVRRMDDKVSQWLLKNWYEPNYDHANAVTACALARFINLPSSLEAIGYPRQWNPARIKKTLRAIKAKGQNVFNGAYMVRGNDGMDKIECVVDYYVAPIHRVVDIHVESMRKTWEQLYASYGFGSFMAGQVVADLRWAMDGEWSDRYTWAPMGPGSLRGLNRLLERPLKASMPQKEFEDRLVALITRCINTLPKTIWSRLEAIDFQNCLCEFDGYERALWGGRKKQRYPGV